MAPQQEIDELFDVKIHFYIGNYQQCINEAAKIKKPSSTEIAIQLVLDEITASCPPEIQPLKLLAEYLHGKSNRNVLLEQLNQKIDTTAQNETLVLVAATIFINEGNFDVAYRYLHTSESLESMALIVDILLKLDRIDLALKKLKEMQEKDDDAILTQLAQAWVHSSMGGDKLQDAYYIYQELVDKYGSTSLLLNGQAVTFIGQGKYEEAEAALQEALTKDSKNADTLINLIALQRHLEKGPEFANRYLSQLKDAHPEHPFIKDLKQKESDFLRIRQQYAPLNPVPA
ncbi:hypothetical protein GWI33_011406 [Rhynchophorus ferrugineus]|uniref:Coatomer subunit epsilon n=1 Tax=Rhynchophorus ferrugineus TaxID=354439 RepID=A0A834IUG7_RHYFE|nr:hypothetical protein GWI33_011406 [Rhynchophorus ferrugineus]